MKRTLYAYNSDTFAYEPVRVTTSQILSNLGVSVPVGLCLGLIAVSYFVGSGRHIEDRFLAERNTALVAELTSVHTRLGVVHQDLGLLHGTDNTFYRSILGIEKLDRSVWDGGVGGTDRYARLSPEVLERTAIEADRLRYQMNLQTESFDRLESLAKSKSEELSHLPAVRPTSGVLVGRYGYRQDPFHGQDQFHPGLDIDANVGDPIYATGAGSIVIAGDQNGWGYGIQVEIDHGFSYHTKYAHLSRTAVALGQRVKRGDLIGYAGSTGYSKGPHLHYEVIKGGDKVNPIDYFIDKK
jgi:murein DD-endopeptidase MepM/ murein hydrolase activator NlpD